MLVENGWLRLVLATMPLLVLTGCGRSAVTPSPGASRTSITLPSSDPKATQHVFGTQGFGLAYGRDWVARFPDGRAWSPKDPPPGQAARWTMVIVGPAATAGGDGRSEIVITIHLDLTGGPYDYQREAAERLSVEHPSEVFRPTTVNELPALTAISRHPNATPAVEGERYVIGTGGIVYELEARAPTTAWSTNAPLMRGIVQSFMQPGG
jgi:hypothetical protein